MNTLIVRLQGDRRLCGIIAVKQAEQSKHETCIRPNMKDIMSIQNYNVITNYIVILYRHNIFHSK